jgi:hypothetical protein
MKNVSNTYGYYLTEDSETVELQGNFKENFIYLPTKDPKEQLNYKVFVSPKKNVNFAIQIVGGDNPQTIYIPQHIYKDLDFAYYENNPYYTIKDITVVKLDFTDTGNKLVAYLKSKFEVPLDNKISKLENVGVSKVSYACFKNGLPNDEEILKQILFLFDEQNDVIFVDKNVKLVDEKIVKERNYKSNRIKGDIAYITNYFTDSGLFISRKLNSDLNILYESTLIYKVTQLADFIKDFTDGRSIANQLGELRNAPPMIDNRINREQFNSMVDAANNIKSQTITNAPKVLGMIMSGIPLVAPLVKGTLDKLAQLKKQNDAKQLEQANAIGSIKGDTTDKLDDAKGLFSTQKSLVSKYQTSVTLPTTNKNKTIPPASTNIQPVNPKIKEIEDKFNAEQAQIRSRDRAASLAGLGGDYDEDSFGNRTYDDPADTLKYQNTLSMLKK